jgi:hypothetical protein
MILIYFKNIIIYKIDCSLYYIVSSLFMSMYELGMCNIFNAEIHGFNPSTSSPDLPTHYICYYTFPFSHTFKDDIDFATSNGATVEIVETIWLEPGNEMVAIYKTFWMRIFQRVCRKWLRWRRFARSSRLYSLLLKQEYQNTKIQI